MTLTTALISIAGLIAAAALAVWLSRKAPKPGDPNYVEYNDE